MSTHCVPRAALVASQSLSFGVGPPSCHSWCRGLWLLFDITEAQFALSQVGVIIPFRGTPVRIGENVHKMLRTVPGLWQVFTMPAFLQSLQGQCVDVWDPAPALWELAV